MLQYDYRQEKLLGDPKKRKQLAVVLVAADASSRLASSNGHGKSRTLDAEDKDEDGVSTGSLVVDRLKQALELNNLQVLTILLSRPAGGGASSTSSTTNSSNKYIYDNSGVAAGKHRVQHLSLDKRLDSQIVQLVERFEQKLRQHELKFHAYIDMLQLKSSHLSGSEIRYDDITSASNALRSAFKQLMVRDETRLVLVNDDRQLIKPQVSSSSLERIKLGQIVQAALHQLARLKHCKSARVTSNDSVGFYLAEIRLTNKQRMSVNKLFLKAIIEVLRWGENDTYNDKSSRACEELNPTCELSEDKLIETIVNLILLLRPRNSRITL